MRCVLVSALATAALADLSALKSMAFHAAWGAANDKRYGKDFGEWTAQDARHTTHLDALTEALEESPVVKHLDLMSVNAAWGAVNERAYGKSRSGAQIDWDMHRSESKKVQEHVAVDFAKELEGATFYFAWYAANKYKYGEGNKDTKESLTHFTERMAAARKLAPANWPMVDVEGLIKSNALGAAAHREADLREKKRERDGIIYSPSEHREDWLNYIEASKKLRKALGTEQDELFQQFDGMCIEGAWAATSERTSGRQSNDARSHWGKFNLHSKAGEAIYSGSAKWVDIHEMIAGAAWGAANERAFGASSKDAMDAWQRYKDRAAKVIASHGGEL